MKRAVILLAVILLLCGLLSGCGQKETPIEGLPMPQGKSLLKTEHGYFFIARTPNWVNLCVYHLTADGQALEPVCKTPDCGHSGPECAAYVKDIDAENGLSAYCRVGYFRDRVCFLECPGDGTVAVVSMDPVTWERKQEMAIDPRAAYEEKPEVVYVNGCFSENTLLLMYTEMSQTKNEGECKTRTEVIDLSTHEGKYLFSEHFDLCVDNRNMKYNGDPYIVGDKLYLAECGLGEMPESSKFLAENRFSQLDLGTGEVRQLIRKQFLTSWTVENDTLYYAECDPNDDHAAFVELDLNSGETRSIPIEKEVHNVDYLREGDHICLAGNERDSIEDMQQPDFVAMLRTYAYFYDREYHLLGEFHSTDGTTVDFTTAEGVYFRDLDRTRYFYLSWADIESGKTELTEVRQ